MKLALSALVSDARYALRSLVRSPALTLVAIATLAIGSGAATTTFAVVDSILLEPLAYPDADRIVSVWLDAPGATLPVDPGGLPLSASMFVTFAEQSRVFEHVGIWTPGAATVTGDGDPEEVPRVAVTVGLLESLGVQPLLGRWFGGGYGALGAGRNIMLSYGYWQRRFGGDMGVVGRTLTVNSQPYEIVGVMPAGFRIADTDADLLMGPMQFDRSALTLPPFAYFGIARLKPGVTVADANADVARMVGLWQESWPPAVAGNPRLYTDVWRIAPAVRPLKQDVVGEIGDLLWVFMATIGVVLLIACANVANLMLIRGAARQHELAIRAALGAGLGRLRRAALLESLAVALVGGVAGLAIAAAGLRALVALAPALPRLGEVALDGDVVAIALSVALLAGLSIGLVFAARVGRLGLQEGLHSSGRTSSGGRSQQRVQRSLVIAQVALAVVVLICAGLSLRTAAALRGVEPGFAGAEQVQTLRISMRGNQVPDAVLVARRQQEILDRFAAMPGVTAVGLASSVPMDRFNALGDSVEIEGRAAEPVVRRFKYVSPGAFAAIGIPLKAGRDYSWRDLYEYRPVAIVSEKMARDLWGDAGAALGKRLRYSEGDVWREVIGVVGDVSEDGLREPVPEIIYWPSLRAADDVSRSVIVVVRTNRAGTEQLSRELQEAVWSVDPNLPVTWVRTLAQIYDESLARTTFTLVTLIVAAGAALALGVVGLYGVLSYTVSLRRREIAIRLALGAQQREVRRRFVRDGVVLAALGIALGIVAAAGVTRLMASLLYDVSATDPLTYVAVTLGLIGVAALASYVPARRASAVDPAESLAAE